MIMSNSLLLNMRGRKVVIVYFFILEVSTLIKRVGYLRMDTKGTENRLVKRLLLLDEWVVHILGVGWLER